MKVVTIDLGGDLGPDDVLEIRVPSQGPTVRVIRDMGPTFENQAKKEHDRIKLMVKFEKELTLVGMKMVPGGSKDRTYTYVIDRNADVLKSDFPRGLTLARVYPKIGTIYWIDPEARVNSPSQKIAELGIDVTIVELQKIRTKLHALKDIPITPGYSSAL